MNESGVLGIATFKGRSRKKGRTEFVAYKYDVNGNEYVMADYYCPSDSREAADAFSYKAKINDKFIVLYSKDSPEESIIRLDYSINDSTDFDNYVIEFERNRKRN